MNGVRIPNAGDTFIRRDRFEWPVPSFKTFLDLSELSRCTVSQEFVGAYSYSISLSGDPNHPCLRITLSGNCSDQNVAINFKFKILGLIGYSCKSVICMDKVWSSFNLIDKAFIRHQQKNVLIDNTLWLMFEFDIFTSRNDSMIDNSMIPECNLINNLSALYKNKRYCDVVFLVDGEEFLAHRNVLAARCAVFAATFEKESQNPIKISDITKETFEKLLEYIYTGKVDNLNAVAMDLLPTAGTCGLERLKLMCAAVLIETLSVENVYKILINAHVNSVEPLKRKAIKLLVSTITREDLESEQMMSLKVHRDLFEDVLNAISDHYFRLSITQLGQLR